MPTPLFLPGETLPAAKLQQLGNDDDTWVPTLSAFTTAPDLGTGPIQDSKIHLNGECVNLWFWFRFGTGSDPGSGTYQVPLPAAYPLHVDLIDTTFGTARMLDDSTAGRETGVIGIDTAGQFMYIRNSANVFSNTWPWVWDDGDWILGHATYLTDFGN